MSWLIAAYGVVTVVIGTYWLRLRRQRRDLER
jgi:CcmD family protein